MKKLFLLIAALGLMTPAFAQKGLHVGVQGGYNASFVLGDKDYLVEEYEYDEKFGRAYGVALGYNLLDWLGVQVEVNSSHKGFNYERMVNDQLIERQLNMEYLDIPVMLKYTSPGPGLQTFVMGGVQYSLLEKIEMKGNFSGGEMMPAATEFFDHDDVAVVTGVGVNFPLPENFFVSFGARATYGLTDVTDPQWRMPRSAEFYRPGRNMTIGLLGGLHYFIPFPGEAE